MSRVYCLAEDRRDGEIGLRFALASLRRVCPQAAVVVYRPKPSDGFREWLATGFPNLRLVEELPAGAYSWNCKPHVLLPALEAGYDEAVWLDSDLIVTRNPDALFDTLNREILVGTQEPPSQPHQGTVIRTTGWELPIGKQYPGTMNSCVLRVSGSHVPLLRYWKELLAEPRYAAAQARPLAERPVQFMSDQDVLNAVIGSAAYANLPVTHLRIGRDVIHCGGAVGYSLSARIGAIFRRTPTFLHAIAGKPWAVMTPEYRASHSRWFTYYRRLLQETSPYVQAARRLRDEVGVPCPWLDVGSVPGRALRVAGFGHHALLGLPLTVLASAAVVVRRVMPR